MPTVLAKNFFGLLRREFKWKIFYGKRGSICKFLRFCGDYPKDQFDTTCPRALPFTRTSALATDVLEIASRRQKLTIVRRTAGVAKHAVEKFQRCVISVQGTYRSVRVMNSNHEHYGNVLLYIRYAL